MSFFSELKRRNVFRMAILYVVGSWLVLQVAELLFDALAVPEWSLRFVLGLLIIGFPLALIFSWVYELTPEGLKREKHVDPEQSITRETARKLDLAVIVLLILAIGLFAIDWFVVQPGQQFTAPQPAVAEDAEPADGAPSEHASIAVLAFDNMSPDADNAYFAEGISEEILNVLSRIEGLKVASRTSAFSFAGKEVPIPEIATQLGVEHVLEGSVRKAGDRVRITAQLIDAKSDAHLWSDSYDRKLTDIFAAQEEIAHAITDSLRDALGVVPAITVDAPTENLAAYELFLRGRNLFYERGSTINTAIGDLRAAVEADTEFAEAWAYLAAACLVAPDYTDEIDPDETNRCAAEASAKALALAPKHSLALAVHGQLESLAGDQVAALETARRSAKSPSQDSTPALWYGFFLFHFGYLDEAVPVLERAYRSDPLVGINNGALGMAYLAQGRDALAKPRIDYAWENGWKYAGFTFAQELAARGERERAVKIFREFMGPSSALPAEILSLFFDAVVEPSKARDLLEAEAQALTDGRIQGLLYQDLLLAVGDLDQFFERVQRRMRERRGSSQSYWLRYAWQPSMEPMRRHRDFLPLLRTLGVVELWETRGYPPGCELVAGDDGEHLDCTEKYR